MTQWKQIEGFENYFVSDVGQVRNANSNKTLAYAKDKDGYLYVSLSKDGKAQKFRVHRLVAQAFIPNPKNLNTVDHINGIKDDNKVSNLQWLSSGDNLNKYWGKRRKAVICLENGVVYRSAYRAGIELGLAYQHIKEVCMKKRRHEKNLHFEYMQEKN